jgi:hypothetical protein
MRKLRCGISTEIADTTGTIIDCMGKLLRGDSFCIPHPFAVSPILTKKAVERTPVIKNGKVFIPIFRF